jgi:hypothetical protein
MDALTRFIDKSSCWRASIEPMLAGSAPTNPLLGNLRATTRHAVVTFVVHDAGLQTTPSHAHGESAETLLVASHCDDCGDFFHVEFPPVAQYRSTRARRSSASCF